MTSLQGKKALVTGGAMGIGLALTERLLKEGAAVTIWDINREKLSSAVSGFKERGYSVFGHVCDIADYKDVKEKAKGTVEEMGGIDILINNAGTVVSGRFCEHEPDRWDRLTSVNLNSLYYTIYEFLPFMEKQNSGHIVNVSSGAGLVGMVNLAVYCATKWAVYGLTESLRMESMVDRKNIHFTSVHPGLIKTGLFEGSKMNILGELILPRVKSHDDIAAAVVKKGLKRKHKVVMKPWSLRSGQFLRGIIPDGVLNRILLMAGGGSIMEEWKGQG